VAEDTKKVVFITSIGAALFSTSRSRSVLARLLTARDICSGQQVLGVSFRRGRTKLKRVWIRFNANQAYWLEGYDLIPGPGYEDFRAKRIEFPEKENWRRLTTRK